MNKDKFQSSLLILMLLALAAMTFGLFKIEQAYKKTQSDKIKIEKRINDLTQSMQTKDKELEAGMRNNYTGLMYKIEFLEREMGVSE